MVRSTRRRTLHYLGAAATGLAGCVGGGTPTASRRTSPGASPTAAGPVLDLGESHGAGDGPVVTVRGVRVERLVRSTSVGSPTHVDVAWLEGHQFAVVEAEIAGGTDESGTGGFAPITDTRFALDVDGTRYPRGDRHRYWVLAPGTDERPGLPAVPVPVAGADSASVVWVRDDGAPVRWTVPTAVVERLAVAPVFAVRSFEVPDRIPRGAPVEASFAVANTGGREGRFVAEFGAGSISDHREVTTTVPAGDVVTVTERLDPYAAGDADETTVTLDWGRERLERRVALTG